MGKYWHAPYKEVLGILRDLSYQKKGFTYNQALQKLKLAPGMFFGEGITWDDIFYRLEHWGWIRWDKYKGRAYLTEDALEAALPVTRTSKEVRKALHKG